MAPKFFDFDYTNESMFEGITMLAGEHGPLVLAITLLCLKLALLYYLYRKKIFLKV
jgi:hypothetical protein